MKDRLKLMAWGPRPSVAMCATLLNVSSFDLVTLDAKSDLTGSPPDILITSSDAMTPEQRRVIADLKASNLHIICDITAVGPQSRRAGIAWTDGEIQALTGLMDTTGFEDGRPVRLGIPFCEITAAFYAAAAIAAASIGYRANKIGQTIDVALFTCAVGSQTTMLPRAFVDAQAKRSGNRHAACAPWNSYEAQNGWVLICTSTDDQWRRMRTAIDDQRLFDPRFETLASRVKHVDELDGLISEHVSQMSVDACLTFCETNGIAAGPIIAVKDLHSEPNFAMRHSELAAEIARNGITENSYGAVNLSPSAPLVPSSSSTETDGKWKHLDTDRALFSGLRVIELGQYTTAPLAGKHLAALGADVTKVEPPEGEATRGWAPTQNGLSLFFALTNTDKTIKVLDLKKPEARDELKNLIRSSDILIENLRPGTLAKFGFDKSALDDLNPNLIYCSVSGFGNPSVYCDRPAFDTTIQAMAGFMDLTRSEGQPLKLGVSAADTLGGQAAFLSVCLALVEGRGGRFLDVTMQDVATWCSLYAASHTPPIGRSFECKDGMVWVDDETTLDSVTEAQSKDWSQWSRDAAVEWFAANNIRGVPVIGIAELVNEPDFVNDVVTVGRDPQGAYWPLTKLPYRFHRTPGLSLTVPGHLPSPD